MYNNQALLKACGSGFSIFYILDTSRCFLKNGRTPDKIVKIIPKTVNTKIKKLSETISSRVILLQIVI
jgi:hypothetical protein